MLFSRCAASSTPMSWCFICVCGYRRDVVDTAMSINNKHKEHGKHVVVGDM
jgi:hypothetical protein